MKQLTCEMCGSTDLIKQDGVFVCQSCGCKYSIEEAKKMMVEGTVEVAGTVKLDNSERLNNLYQIARRARDDNNSENAAKYYDMILVEDPTSWEASFYVVYFKALSCKIAQIQSAAISVSNCIDSVLLLIHDHVKGIESQVQAVSEISIRSTLISSMLYNGAKSHYQSIDFNIRNKYAQEWLNNACAARDIMYTLGDQIEKIFGDVDAIAFHSMSADAWKSGIKKHKELLPIFSNEVANDRIIASYADKISKYDPEYKAGIGKELNEKRKQTLKREMEALNKQIANISAKQHFNFDGSSILFICVGLFAIFSGMYVGPTFGAAHIWMYFGGVAFIGFGVLMAKPASKEQIEKNKEKVKELEEKKAVLQTEYDSIS